MCFSGIIPPLCTKYFVVIAQYNMMHKASPYKPWNVIWSKLSWQSKSNFQHKSSNLFPNNTYEAYFNLFQSHCLLAILSILLFTIRCITAVCISTPFFSRLQHSNTQCNLHTPGSHGCDSCSKLTPFIHCDTIVQHPVLYKDSRTSQMHFNLSRPSLMSPSSTNLHQFEC
jgi:hypothetical protein